MNPNTDRQTDRQTDRHKQPYVLCVYLCLASTDADGRARVDVPVGEYELYVRSPGYQPYAEPVTVTGDTPLRVAAARVSDADFDDDQVWM